MSLLSICQDVAENTPLEVPTTVFGSSNKTAKMLFSCAKDAGEYISRCNDEGWTSQHKVYEFLGSSGTLVNSETHFSLPSDYKKLIDGTVWDRTNYWQARGALTPRQWQVRKSSILGNTVSTTKRFRLKYNNGKTIVFDPEPVSTDSFLLEYVSKNWCESSGGTDQATWAADTDVPLIADEHVFYLETRWRVLRRLGMAYDDEKKEARDELSKTKGQDAGGQDLVIGGFRPIGLISTQNIPDTGFGS